MKYLMTLIIIISAIGLLTIPAFGTNISGAQYLTKILVSNNTTNSYTNVIIPLTCNTTSMIDAGMMSSSATDIVLQNDAGQDVAVMPGNPGQPWMLFTDSISSLKQQWKFLYSKGVTSDMVAYFPDTAGMYIEDSETFEFGCVFSISLTGFIDITQVGQVIFNKTNAISCNITGSGNITAAIYATSISVTASGLSSREQNIKVESDGYHLSIYIDGVLKDSKP